jgi:cytochrome c2
MRPTRLPLLLLLLPWLAACDEPTPPPHLRVAGGDAERGRVAMVEGGCGACHRIPGVRNARAMVGPPLDDYAQRGYVAGLLPNRPANLVAWLRDPTAISPRTAMPDLGLSEAVARDMAAYLYTLGASGAGVYPPWPQPVRTMGPGAPPDLRPEE